MKLSVLFIYTVSFASFSIGQENPAASQTSTLNYLPEVAETSIDSLNFNTCENSTEVFSVDEDQPAPIIVVTVTGTVATIIITLFHHANNIVKRSRKPIHFTI